MLYLCSSNNEMLQRQEDEAIVHLQEFALAARVGKGKAASNVQPRKDASELIIYWTWTK